MSLKGAVVHEDDDPLVVAAVRAFPDTVRRRPGLIEFVAPVGGGEIRVRRSRFDPEYGSICSLAPFVGDEMKGEAAWAPVGDVIAALCNREPAKALAIVWKKWDDRSRKESE